jgi:F0F1-type ATP synthase epsilon subunit
VFEPWRLVIRTPAETALEAHDVTWVQVQLADGGPITILPGHAPLLAESVAAPLRYVDGAGDHSVLVNAGLLYVARGEVTVYTTGRGEPSGSLGHGDGGA